MTSDVQSKELATQCCLYANNFSWSVSDITYVLFKKFGMKSMQYKGIAKGIVEMYTKQLVEDKIANFDSLSMRFKLNMDNLESADVVEVLEKQIKEKKDAAP